LIDGPTLNAIKTLCRDDWERYKDRIFVR